MAAPITEIQKLELTEEEIKNKRLDDLVQLLTEHKESFENLFKLIDDFNDTGALEAANAMILAKNDILKIGLEQISREPMTNLINTMLGTAGVFMKADHDLVVHLMESAIAGIDEGTKFIGSDEKISLFSLLKSLSDPDINRAVGFGLAFLKGMGKALEEPVPKKEEINEKTKANI